MLLRQRGNQLADAPEPGRGLGIAVAPARGRWDRVAATAGHRRQVVLGQFEGRLDRAEPTTELAALPRAAEDAERTELGGALGQGRGGIDDRERRAARDPAPRRAGRRASRARTRATGRRRAGDGYAACGFRTCAATGRRAVAGAVAVRSASNSCAAHSSLPAAASRSASTSRRAISNSTSSAA